MEDRRRIDDKNWDEIKNFIIESREYRIKDDITQKYQVDNIESLKNKVEIQNGKVFKLESWKQEIEQRIKQRKDNYAMAQAVITIVATVVMAIAAWITIFKK